MLFIHLGKEPVNTKAQHTFDLWKKDDIEKDKHRLKQCFPVEDKIVADNCCVCELSYHASHYYCLQGSGEKPVGDPPSPPAAGTTPSATVKAGHQEWHSLVSTSLVPPRP